MKMIFLIDSRLDTFLSQGVCQSYKAQNIVKITSMLYAKSCKKNS